MEPAIVKTAAPTDHPLAVIGHRVGKGRYADCWDHVVVEARRGRGHALEEARRSRRRLRAARLHGLRGARRLGSTRRASTAKPMSCSGAATRSALARSMRRKADEEGYGWTNLSLADADAKALEVDKLKAAAHWALAIDFRPHSHHYYALAAGAEEQARGRHDRSRWRAGALVLHDVGRWRVPGLPRSRSRRPTGSGARAAEHRRFDGGDACSQPSITSSGKLYSRPLRGCSIAASGSPRMRAAPICGSAPSRRTNRCCA